MTAMTCGLCQQAAATVVDPRLGPTCPSCIALVRSRAGAGSPVRTARTLAARLLGAAAALLGGIER